VEEEEEEERRERFLSYMILSTAVASVSI